MLSMSELLDMQTILVKGLRKIGRLRKQTCTYKLEMVIENCQKLVSRNDGNILKGRKRVLTGNFDEIVGYTFGWFTKVRSIIIKC